MGWLRRTWIGGVSELSWRLPGWPARLFTAFSQSERGSAYDVLYAIEHTRRRDLRLRYFRHAMDEARHAGIFLQRASALGAADRAQAVMADGGYLGDHGIYGGETLFDKHGEMGFLAFVYVAEADAVEQFKVYLDRELPDAESREYLKGILKDERFHVSYSKAALDFYQAPDAVARAIRQIRFNRWKEGWLRFSVHVGHAVNAVWMTLMYLVLVAPFSPFARVERGGWQPARRALPTTLPAAQSQA